MEDFGGHTFNQTLFTDFGMHGRVQQTSYGINNSLPPRKLGCTRLTRTERLSQRSDTSYLKKLESHPPNSDLNMPCVREGKRNTILVTNKSLDGKKKEQVFGEQLLYRSTPQSITFSWETHTPDLNCRVCKIIGPL